MDYPAFDVLVFVMKKMQALLAKKIEPEDSIETQTFFKKVVYDVYLLGILLWNMFV
jgi:hypothetical protein